MSKIEVTIYCDATGLFSEAECNRDNMCELMFDERVVKEFFYMFLKPDYDLDIGFEQWFTDEYTCDDTYGLYDFAVSKGDHPYFNIDNPTCVFYRDESNYKWIVFEGNPTECREFGREHGWVWHYNGDYEYYELEVC